jgi:hypothetical protein
LEGEADVAGEEGEADEGDETGEAVAAADAADVPAAELDDEDEPEDVHPAARAPRQTKAAASQGGLIVLRSVISAILSQRHPGRHPLTYP